MNTEIKDIFKAESQTVFKTLGRAGTAYQIPSYQRSYSWKEENIYRLIEDVSYGIRELVEDSDTLSFLGTFIVTPLTPDSESPSDALSIVDGQQRLTTIVLILALLHEELRVGKNNLPSVLKVSGFEKEIKKTLQKIEKCLFDNHGMSDDEYDLQPVITRDIDTWANNKFTCVYDSAIPKLLHGYAKYLYSKNEERYVFTIENKSKEFEELNSRLKYIQGLLEKTYKLDKNDESLYLGKVQEIFLNENIKEKLLTYRSELEQFSLSGISTLGDEDKKIIYAIVFTKYLMERVILTKVMASEKYAFDVFESLNTTGEPLTALETFKPKLIQLINEINGNKLAYINSDSKKYLEVVENYIEELGEKSKQSETQNIVNSFALLYSGDVLGKSLSAQRKYLREQVNAIDDEHTINDLVFKLGELITFRKNIWDDENLEYQLKELPDRNVVLTCCEFLRSAKKTLTIPILTRYYSEAIVSADFATFSKVVKSLTSFTMLWRTAFGGTNGIDTVYKELMSYGYKKKKKVNADALNEPLCYSNKSLPPAEVVFKILLSHLKSKGIDSFDDWYRHSKITNVYNASGPIAKMFLLIANHKTLWDNKTQELIKEARGNVNEYLNLNVWNSQRSYSIEHVAPQNRNSNSTWDKKIYDELYTVNTIGNLTLLPQKENSAVANGNWDKKRIYFNCFVQRDRAELDAAIKLAKSQGISIPTRVVKELVVSEYLDFLEPILNQKDWNKTDIEKRTHNLSMLLWQECSEWLPLN